MIKEFEHILEDLTKIFSQQSKEHMFEVLNDKLNEQENPLLQTFIKICSYLLKI
jgi:hypothetical protein